MTATSTPVAGPGAHSRRVVSSRVLLTNGTPALIRPLGVDDATDLLALHEKLPEHDRYLRFSTLHPADLPGSQLGERRVLVGGQHREHGPVGLFGAEPALRHGARREVPHRHGAVGACGHVGRRHPLDGLAAAAGPGGGLLREVGGQRLHDGGALDQFRDRLPLAAAHEHPQHAALRGGRVDELVEQSVGHRPGGEHPPVATPNLDRGGEGEGVRVRLGRLGSTAARWRGCPGSGSRCTDVPQAAVSRATRSDGGRLRS